MSNSLAKSRSPGREVAYVLKQGNETAESTLVPLQNGVVNFNQTLRLSVNMYFDMTTNKFVEKKV